MPCLPSPRGSARTVVAAFAAAVLLTLPSNALAQAAAPDMETVRQALEKYQDPYVAVHDMYFSTLGCIEYPNGGGEGEMQYPPGGMGVHFLNVPLIDGELDPMRPEVLIYERLEDGSLRLAAAEWFVPAAAVDGPPSLFGRQFDGPMEGHRPLMPEGFHHYDLHVWLWKDNPAGTYIPTNPALKCPAGGYTVLEDAPKMVGHPGN